MRYFLFQNKYSIMYCCTAVIHIYISTNTTTGTVVQCRFIFGVPIVANRVSFLVSAMPIVPPPWANDVVAWW